MVEEFQTLGLQNDLSVLIRLIELIFDKKVARTFITKARPIEKKRF